MKFHCQVVIFQLSLAVITPEPEAVKKSGEDRTRGVAFVARSLRRGPTLSASLSLSLSSHHPGEITRAFTPVSDLGITPPPAAAELAVDSSSSSSTMAALLLRRLAGTHRGRVPLAAAAAVAGGAALFCASSPPIIVRANLLTGSISPAALLSLSHWCRMIAGAHGGEGRGCRY